MTEGELSTGLLQEYLGRWRAGEEAAMDELLRLVFSRLRHLAVRMLRGFPNIRPLIDSDDLLQNSVLRFMRTLQSIRPQTTRDFFNLAAVHMRREMLDWARRAKRRLVAGRHWHRRSDACSCPEQTLPDSETIGSDEFDLWVRFHEAVDSLPLEEREVVGLVFYHGWKQNKIAELFNVSVRTVRRRWFSACQRLRLILGRDFQ